MPLLHSQTFEGFQLESTDGSFPTMHHKRKIEYSEDDASQMVSNCGDCRVEPNVSFPKRKCHRSDLSTYESQSQEMSQDQDLPGCLKDSASLSSAPPSVLLSSSFLSSSLPHSVTSLLPRNNASNNLADHFLSRMQQRNEEEELNSHNNNTAFVQFQASLPSGEITQMNLEDVDAGFYARAGLSGIHINNLNGNGNNNNIVNPEESSQTNHSNNEMMDESTVMESDYVPDMSQYTPSTASNHLQSRSITPPRDIERNGDRRGTRPSPVSGRLHCYCSASWRGMYGIDSGYITDYY